MTIVAGVIVTIGALLGVLLTLLTLPGTWLMLLAAVACWAWRPELYGWGTIAVVAGLAVLGEILETAWSAVGARRSGGGWRSAVGGVVGALLGAIGGTILLPVPIVGTIVGAVLGAGLGAGLAERTAEGREWQDAYRVGVGAARGRLVSIIVKTGVAGAMASILIVAAFI